MNAANQSSPKGKIVHLAKPPASAPDSRPVALDVSRVWKVYGMSKTEFGALDPDLRNSEEFARRGAVAAVRDSTFSIAKGEVFVIMGLSGSGKSTLVRCLTRLIEPTCGEIRINGENLLEASPKRLTEIRRKHFGMVFQHFALLPNRTVLGNILFPLEVQGVARETAEARARELITMVGLEGREMRFPSELSGGQQQRIGIARSLATDPDLWFLDEPFSALDPLIRTDLQDELLRLQATLAKTIAFITHDLDEAIRIADRIAIMEGGRIVQIGTPEDLIIRPATDYVRRFVAKVAPAKVVRCASIMQPGTPPVPANDSVHGRATIESVATRIVRGSGPLTVTDTSGNRIGWLDRATALDILAGTLPEGTAK